jgi:hypothetical protein
LEQGEKRQKSLGLSAEGLPLLLRACSFHADQVLRKGDALAAFGFAPQPGINLGSPLIAAAHSGAQVFFADCVADTDYHRFAFSVNAN